MNNFTRQNTITVKTNEQQGKYFPFFFTYKGFRLKEINFESLYYNEEDIESAIIKNNYSFAYLRDNKIRLVDAVDLNGTQIDFEEFTRHLGISINTNNIFKAGKYLSRVFRATKHGGFYKNIDLHINESSRYSDKLTDGISLVSTKLARSLGWDKAEPGRSAQFTLFYKDGLVKGHCVVSDKIKHDIILYGDGNIKKEICLSGDINYIALEPVKLGKKLRLDIQSLLNLYPIFDGRQYLEWAYDGIIKYREDLFSGKLSEWLDDYGTISAEDFDKESWVLRKAVYHKIDYTKFPGLIRSGWAMFKNSIMRFAKDNDGAPVFRIPVPGGKRAYLRVDLRNHDCDGNFTSDLQPDEVELDKYGNLWFSPDNLEKNTLYPWRRGP